MSEYIKKLFGILVTAILAHTGRLARLAAIRHELDAYASAYDDAKALEAAGKPELARFARRQIEETLGGALSAADLPAVNGDGELSPFALPRPTAAGLNPPEGQAPRRRGRRPSGADGAKTAREETPEDDPSERPNPTEPPTTTSTDPHP